VQLATLQKTAGTHQQAVGKANEQALLKLDALVAVIEAELKKERGADAILRAQDTLYFNANYSGNVTNEIYARLNARLPKISLPESAPGQKLP
jgi:Skp family chaperone for outer membrane proteins